MPFIDFTAIIREAWMAYDSSREIARITDISAQVSTNHVYRIVLKNKSIIIGKLSYFGKYDYFVEDHTIINSLSNNLPAPFEHFLARSLMKGNSLFVHRHKDEVIDAWVVFYRPIQIRNRPPRRLSEEQIVKLAEQFAHFHRACHNIRNTLPPSSKTLETDIHHLLDIMDTDVGRHEYRLHEKLIREQAGLFFESMKRLKANAFDKIPVFVDWNIGNFSLTSSFKFFSRWDYDWFRMSSRMMDFYFISRIVSDIGDRTVFTYNIGPLMEERFILFLKTYHQSFPFRAEEVRFLKEVYRFFLLNYVIKDGRYFFHEIFATKLQKEAYETHLPSIEEKFDADILLNALNL
ncbi:MAG: hypothetical protein KDD06_09725 [Phaeodactylibacter sp.]|nr:hypothetical protein [Phaeodactylibacter sp.]MCB9266730.1 hypothetical protein [Lewinellaceae bacterium]MCB9286600.1 hypothetical protein [Lewinellaceae bacterium]